MMATTTKERPIIFSGPMVHAILAGKKTQTRRVVKPQPPSANLKCPYKVGMRLWVRETWQETDEALNVNPGVVYRATDPDWESMDGWKWRPSIFMPRCASRLTLEITDVRVQRLQEISEVDAESEGVTLLPIDHRPGWAYRSTFEQLWDSLNSARGFGWQANPWVWAITFEVVK